MKSSYSKLKKLLKDNRAVFGLTSVQQFFAVILGVALLAYVIVVIMATLNSNSNIFPDKTDGRVSNETGNLNSTLGYVLTAVNQSGFNAPAIVIAINKTDGLVINSGNYTVSNSGVVTNTTTRGGDYNTVDFTYTFNYNGVSERNANAILTNTSVGISGFFANVNPVYAILAILVIILVLVVLVRVVAGQGIGQRSSAGPQL